MTSVDIIVLILVLIGVYHIIEVIRFENFKKNNEQLLKDFEEYEKRNNNKY